MAARHHANLAVSFAAIRELIQETLQSHCADAGAATRTLGLAAEALDALWSALEGEAENGARGESDRADFFDFAPDPCVFTDVNGGVRCANSAAAKLLGVSAAELLHRPIAAILGTQQQVMPGYLRELMAQGRQPRALRWRATVGGADGSVSVEVSVCEAGRSSGRVTGLCWLLRPLGGAPVAGQGAAPTAVAAPPPDLPALSQTPR